VSVSIGVLGAFKWIAKQIIFRLYHGRFAGRVGLQGPADQSLEQLAHLGRISLDCRQVSYTSESQRQQNECAHDTCGTQRAVPFHVASS